MTHPAGTWRFDVTVEHGSRMSDLTEELLEAAMAELEVEADRGWSSRPVRRAGRTTRS